MGEDQLVSVSLTIVGKVQGVYYRASTKEKAQSLGLSGFVKNKLNGNVYIECTGATQKIQEFIEWCWDGPQMAVVENVIVLDLMEFHKGSFKIAYL